MQQQTARALIACISTTLGLACAARADTAATAPASPDQVRAIVAEMIADSETRSSLLESGGTAGYDGKHFVLTSPDGKFKLQVEGQIQLRYNLNFQDSDPALNSTGDGFESGFQTRRVRLAFSGHVFQPEMFYKILSEFSRSSGALGLLEAYVGYRFDDGWSIQGGQFKLPLLREELVSSKYQLAVDRSVTNSYFTQNYSQGVMLSRSQEDWRAFVAFSDGVDSRNTDLYNSASPGVEGLDGDPADWALTGRLDVKLAGDWKQFDQFTSPQGSTFGAMIGGAISYEQSEDRNDGFDTADRLWWTADATIQGDGWSVFGEYVGQNVQDGNQFDTFTGQNATNQGLVVQGGVYASESLEFFARFDQIFFGHEAGTPPVTTNEFATITGGFNYYVYGQAAKLSMDVQWFLNNAPAFLNNPGLNLLAPAEKNEVAIRFQVQLLF